jgi:hypothetical protein
MERRVTVVGGGGLARGVIGVAGVLARVRVGQGRPLAPRQRQPALERARGVASGRGKLERALLGGVDARDGSAVGVERRGERSVENLGVAATGAEERA